MSTENTGKKIVLIEDDQLYRVIIDKKLSSRNCNVRSAKNGEEGMNLLLEETPDLILLDLIMPKKNGFEVLREIRKNSELAEVPVVILSVLGQDKDIEEAKKLGANDYIIKSTVSMEDALDKIMSHC